MTRIQVGLCAVAAAALGIVGCGDDDARPMTDGGGDSGSMVDGGMRDDGGPGVDGLMDVDGGGETSDGGTCPIAMLDCTSGMVMGDTASGTSLVSDWESCGASATAYTGAESAYTFSNGAATRQGVTIVAHRISSTDDYDLFVVGGGTTSCDGAGTCTDSSSGTSEDETVAFAAAPGENFSVYYDRYTDTAGTTTFSLTVTCVALTCGDGTVAAAFEECDDGNAADGDGCSATCATESGFSCTGEPSVCVPSCGDGVVDFDEGCDDGNTAAGDGCSAMCLEEAGFSCTGEPSVCARNCGNGMRDVGELCDDGNAAAGDGCVMCLFSAGFGCLGEPSVCTAFMCGNGARQGGETCDDSNVANGDGCSSTCKAEMFTATAAAGASVMLSGNLATSTTTFDRPFADCTGLSGNTVHYQTFVIENTTAAAQTLTLTATWGGDGFLLVYQPSLAPATPLDRCIVGDDDFGAGDGSEIVGLVVPSRQQLIVVATTFNDDAAALAPFTIAIATM